MCLHPEALRWLAAFRQELYAGLGHRKDSLFELLDAALTAPDRSPLVRLSLGPAFRRGWPSTCDALADGSMDQLALRRLFHAHLPPSRDERPLWALDGTHWPRPAALTSPERTYERRVATGRPRDGVVPAWAYQWLVAVPEPQGSWMLPLDVRRRGPTAGLPTTLALAQLQAALAERPPTAPRPVVTLDTGYDVSVLAQAHLPADLLVRLAKRRRLYRAPEPYAGHGRPRKHGAAFRLHDPTTHGQADHTLTLQDPGYGRVQFDAWDGLHDEAAAADSFCVLRVQVEHLLHRAGAPAPLWLAWIGQALPTDLLQVWRWYQRRFAIEHRQPQRPDRRLAGRWSAWLCVLSESRAGNNAVGEFRIQAPSGRLRWFSSWLRPTGQGVPELATGCARFLDQPADALGEVTVAVRAELFRIGSRHSHGGADQRFAIGGRASRTSAASTMQ